MQYITQWLLFHKYPPFKGLTPAHPVVFGLKPKGVPPHPPAPPVTLRPPCPPFTKLGFNSVGWCNQTEIKSPLCVAGGGGLLTGFYYSGGWRRLMPSFRAPSTRRWQFCDSTGPCGTAKRDRDRERERVCVCRTVDESWLSVVQAGMARGLPV